MSGTLDWKTTDQLQKLEEVRVVTSAPGGAKHRATIWVVVVDGAVFVRSFTGPTGRWHQNIIANPRAALGAAGKTLHVNAVPVSDPKMIERVSKAYLDKYRDSPYAKDMVRPEVLPTTLRLESA